MAPVGEKELTTRVNSSHLPRYIGKTVRLICKTIKFGDNGRLTVEASDGGQVLVHVIGDEPITDPYVEIIGKVADGTTIQMLACTNLGSDIDLKLVNDTISLIHDPRFYSKMFSYDD